MTIENQPSIDPTMRVYCPIHSELPGRDGARTGAVAATFGKDEWGREGYSCWHCEMRRVAEGEAIR